MRLETCSQANSIRQEIAGNKKESSLLLGKKDLATIGEVVLPARGMAFVKLRAPELKDVAHLFRADRSDQDINFHVRSRYAHLGLHLPDPNANWLETFTKENQTEDTGIFVLVENHCARPILIEDNTDIVRPYRFAGPPITGEALKELLTKRMIDLTGEKGTDWEFWTHPDHPEEPYGIELRLDPRSRMWIPPRDNDEPILIDTKGETNRREAVNDLFVAIDDPRFALPPDYLCISSTTSQVNLTDVHGFIDTSLPHKGNKKQIASPAINGDQTDHVIRTEQDADEGVPDSVVITFVH
ncbi:MAG: hypothetical protein AAB553_06365 [Patescibacteria group bacterium]